MLSRKPICITAYLIVAFCTLACSIQFFREPDRRSMWIHLGVKSPLGVKVINAILLAAAVTTIVCSVQWFLRKTV